MVLLMAGQGGWTAGVVAKDAQMKVRKQLQAAKGPTENRQSDSPTKTANLLFLRGC
jgi:hypothetical protein